MVERWGMRSSWLLLLLLKGYVAAALLDGLNENSGMSDSADKNQFALKTRICPNL